MRYCDLRPAADAYRKGENVTQKLRSMLSETHNTPQIIEIAYDLQAGSYIAMRNSAPEQWRAYVAELAAILRTSIAPGDRVLDAGTGEMTTLVGVAGICYGAVSQHYAMDISWSRIAVGCNLVENELAPELASKLSSFVGNLLRIPMQDKSIDVVWTSHAIEPNRGREEVVLAELFRVARKRLVLFEPSYEYNSPEGRARMDSLGYARGLPAIIRALGGRIDEVQLISAPLNPLNPTYAYVVTPPGSYPKDLDSEWICPATGLPIERFADCFWSEASGLAYPIIGGIPILREEAAILASGFAKAPRLG
jgi:ubiquinone/menaquinone biosynthesis C-methylase UbiE